MFATQNQGEEEAEEEKEVDIVSEDYDGDTVIINPTFSFQCSAAGIFPHDNSCSKFWLCKAGKDGQVKPAELYKCPSGFLFQDEVRRCQREEQVECDKPPVLRIGANLEPPAITLQISELDSFFARWG